MAKFPTRSVAPQRARIRVGIGSWADPEYVGVLFPKGVKPPERLPIYATWFDHVELNLTFYRTPTPAVVAGWVQQTPEGFMFLFKLHQAFARSPVKAAQGALVGKVRASLEPLVRAGRLGALFLVLPPTFGPEKHQLDELDGIAEQFGRYPFAVELRHSAWLDGDQREKTFAYFRERKVTLIGVDMPRIKGSTILPPIDEITNPQLAYLRLHGRNKQWLKGKSAAEKHAYAYRPKDIAELAARIRRVAAKAEQVYVVANNHAEDYAPKAALALARALGLEKRTAL